MTQRPDKDTCYLLGLILAGGEMSKSTFTITLPFNKWGDLKGNNSDLHDDFLKHVFPRFQKVFNIHMRYIINDKGEYIYTPSEKPSNESMEKIREGLGQLGLPFNQTLIETADLSRARSILREDEAEMFLSGVFDARASVAPSHRRFTDSAPVVSIEIPGKHSNFRFVVQLCAWLTDLESVTDQVLYNHPSFHASLNPEYKGWRKGFKIRLLAASFFKRHSFVMDTFAGEVTKLNDAQKVRDQVPCMLRQLNRPRVTGIHEDIDSAELPSEVRDKIFLHYFHVCATMKCPHAPLEQVQSLVSKANELVSAFPLLLKTSRSEAESKFNLMLDNYFSDLPIAVGRFSVDELMKNEPYSRYPTMKQGIAYLFAESLNGKRPRGPAESIIESALGSQVFVKSPEVDGDPPLLLYNLKFDRGIIVSNPAGDLNKFALDQVLEIDGIDLNVRKIKRS